MATCWVVVRELVPLTCVVWRVRSTRPCSDSIRRRGKWLAVLRLFPEGLRAGSGGRFGAGAVAANPLMCRSLRWNPEAGHDMVLFQAAAGWVNRGASEMRDPEPGGRLGDLPADASSPPGE